MASLSSHFDFNFFNILFIIIRCDRNEMKIKEEKNQKKSSQHGAFKNAFLLIMERTNQKKWFPKSFSSPFWEWNVLNLCDYGRWWWLCLMIIIIFFCSAHDGIFFFHKNIFWHSFCSVSFLGHSLSYVFLGLFICSLSNIVGNLIAYI